MKHLILILIVLQLIAYGVLYIKYKYAPSILTNNKFIDEIGLVVLFVLMLLCLILN